MEEQSIYVVGFIIGSDVDEPNFYALYVCNDDDRPIVLDREILFFQRLELATSVLNKSDDNHKNELINQIPQEVEMICDISSIFYLIEYEDVDSSSEILNFLNILFDFIKSIDVDFPENYKEYLHKFADYLTFQNEYGDFFRQESIERSFIIESLYWCLGSIFANSKIIQS